MECPSRGAALPSTEAERRRTISDDPFRCSVINTFARSRGRLTRLRRRLWRLSDPDDVPVRHTAKKEFEIEWNETHIAQRRFWVFGCPLFPLRLLLLFILPLPLPLRQLGLIRLLKAIDNTKFRKHTEYWWMNN